MENPKGMFQERLKLSHIKLCILFLQENLGKCIPICFLRMQWRGDLENCMIFGTQFRECGFLLIYTILHVVQLHLLRWFPKVVACNLVRITPWNYLDHYSVCKKEHHVGKRWSINMHQHIAWVHDAGELGNVWIPLSDHNIIAHLFGHHHNLLYVHEFSCSCWVESPQV